MTDMTAEVARSSALVARQRLLRVLVADAPPEADTFHHNDERLPGWACAAIITGLAASSWAVIIFGVVALLSR